ncbi:MAG: hypothetical protein AAF702_24715 [Chloroflexota bacterium]
MDASMDAPMDAPPTPVRYTVGMLQNETVESADVTLQPLLSPTVVSGDCSLAIL